MSKDSKEEIKKELKELVKQIEQLKEAHKELAKAIKTLEANDTAKVPSKEDSFLFMKDQERGSSSIVATLFSKAVTWSSSAA